MILVIAPIDQRTRIKDKTTSPSDNALMIPVTKRKKTVYGPLFSSKTGAPNENIVQNHST